MADWADCVGQVSCELSGAATPMVRIEILRLHVYVAVLVLIWTYFLGEKHFKLPQ